jgi:arginase
MTQKKPFALLGTSIWQGQPKPGVDRSFDYLKLVGFWEDLQKNYDYVDLGALDKAALEQIYNDLFHKTLEIINKGYRPLLLGGDHSQAFASISAIGNKYEDLRILWIDAHADMNTPETSPSGNSHGMPLAGLFGWVDKNIWGMPWMNQLLKPHQVVQLGIRDADAGEIELMKKYGVEYYPPEAIREQGLSNILDDVAQRWQGLPTHLSFDIDGLDQALVPATGTPVGDGLTMDDAKMIIERVRTDFNLIAAEIVEFNPDLAKNPEELRTTETNVKQLIEWVLADFKKAKS